MDIEKQIELGAKWIREHQERFWATTGATLFLILLVALVVHHRQTENDEAWFQLGAIHGQLMQGKLTDARKGLDDWQKRFLGTSASSYAKFLGADLSYRTTDYAGAAQIYGDLSQTGQPDTLKPLALSAQVASEEMAGHIPQAQALAKKFLETYPDHFETGPMYMTQARLAETAGDSAAAAAIYDRFILLYPQSPWTAFARARTQALAGTAKSSAPALASSPIH